MLKDFSALVLGSISALYISQCLVPQNPHVHSHNLTDSVEKDLEEILKSYFGGKHIPLNTHLGNYFRFIHIVEERPDLDIPYIESLILTNLAMEYNSMTTLPKCLIKPYSSLDEIEALRRIFDMVLRRSDLYEFYYEPEIFSLLTTQDGCTDIYYLDYKERNNLRQTMFGLIDYVDATSTELASKYYSLDDSFDCIDTSYYTPEEKDFLRFKLLSLTNDRSDIDSYLTSNDIDTILNDDFCQPQQSEKDESLKINFKVRKIPDVVPS